MPHGMYADFLIKLCREGGINFARRRVTPFFDKKRFLQIALTFLHLSYAGLSYVGIRVATGQGFG